MSYYSVGSMSQVLKRLFDTATQGRGKRFPLGMNSCCNVLARGGKLAAPFKPFQRHTWTRNIDHKNHSS